MKSEEEIRKQIRLLKYDADYYKSNYDYYNANKLLNQLKALNWVLEDE